MGPARKSIEERFKDAYSVESSTGCWVWLKYKNSHGYGMLCEGGRNGRMIFAHRFSYEFNCDAIPDGLDIDHLCRNRACVNPAHLEPVTHRENILRGMAPSALCARQVSCKRGHPFDEKNTGRYRGKRYCRACARDKSAAYRENNRVKYNAYMTARSRAKSAERASYGSS